MNTTENDVITKPKPRRYKRITPIVVERFKTEEIIQGNGSAAVRVLEPEHKSEGNKSWRIRQVEQQEVESDFVPKRVQQIAIKAIERVGEMVNSTDENVATRNAHFVIDHAIGKATQRTENTNLNINIESVLK